MSESLVLFRSWLNHLFPPQFCVLLLQGNLCSRQLRHFDTDCLTSFPVQLPRADCTPDQLSNSASDAIYSTAHELHLLHFLVRFILHSPSYKLQRCCSYIKEEPLMPRWWIQRIWWVTWIGWERDRYVLTDMFWRTKRVMCSAAWRLHVRIPAHSSIEDSGLRLCQDGGGIIGGFDGCLAGCARCQTCCKHCWNLHVKFVCRIIKL